MTQSVYEFVSQLRSLSYEAIPNAVIELAREELNSMHFANADERQAFIDKAHIVLSEPAKKTFREELSSLINSFSLENGSNTPDFILAEYLNMSLSVFDHTTKTRDKWFGRDAAPFPEQNIKISLLGKNQYRDIEGNIRDTRTREILSHHDENLKQDTSSKVDLSPPPIPFGDGHVSHERSFLEEQVTEERSEAATENAEQFEEFEKDKSDERTQP